MDTEPERGVPRLFVGNLVPSIGDEALRRTLSRYGAVRSVERHPDYAHVSIVPADDGALERCVAALHRTKWQGTELRVERAREHWATKLRRERDEEKAARAAGALDAAARPPNAREVAGYSESGKGSVAFKFKGVRTVVADDDSEVSVCDDEEIMARFDDDDTVMLGRTPGLEHAVLDGQVTSESESESEPMDSVEPAATLSNSRSPSVAAAAESSSDESQSDDAGTSHPGKADEVTPEPRAEEPPTAPGPTRTSMHKPSAAVASTLELFGLDEPSAAPEPARASAKSASTPSHGLAAAPAPAPPSKKRPRAERALRDAGYDAAALAAEADPAALDRGRERALARGVLARLFPAEIIAAAPGEAAGAAELDRVAGMLRRPALFRGLLAARGAAPAARDGVKSRPVAVGGAAKKFKRYAGKSSVELGLKGCGVRRAAGPRAVSSKVGAQGNAAQRAGLFRTLIA